jgi:hypothetical protein
MLACASMGVPAKGSWGSYQAWWAEGNRKQGYSFVCYLIWTLRM